jgi:hypothetical protein
MEKLDNLMNEFGNQISIASVEKEFQGKCNTCQEFILKKNDMLHAMG